MRNFSPRLLNYFFHLNHVGALPADTSVFCVEEGGAEQGDAVKLAVKIQEDQLQLARFQCYGGVALMSTCEYVCTWLEGKTVTQAKKINAEGVLAALELSPLYIHTAVKLVDLVRKLLRTL